MGVDDQLQSGCADQVLWWVNGRIVSLRLSSVVDLYEYLSSFLIVLTPFWDPCVLIKAIVPCADGFSVFI